MTSDNRLGRCSSVHCRSTSIRDFARQDKTLSSSPPNPEKLIGAIVVEGRLLCTNKCAQLEGYFSVLEASWAITRTKSRQRQQQRLIKWESALPNGFCYFFALSEMQQIPGKVQNESFCGQFSQLGKLTWDQQWLGGHFGLETKYLAPPPPTDIPPAPFRLARLLLGTPPPPSLYFFLKPPPPPPRPPPQTQHSEVLLMLLTPREHRPTFRSH